ncbi:MAG: hypothetical protein QF731_02480 [Verrucomicrobiota bacterium]|nr:hypothetical protein [Verrucomicrobiota bacterium]
MRGSRPLEGRWIVFLVFICCWGLVNQAFSQRQQVEPIAPLTTNAVSSKTPPRPVLPPKTVAPRKKKIKTVVPDRLPENISRLLKNRSGYKTVNSQSGQFMVYGPISPKRRGGILDVNLDTILIGPDHVAIAADRLRAAMLKRLEIPLFLGGKVKIRLNPTLNPIATVPVVTVRHLSGYSYELTLPCEIEASKLVRALVQVTLLDLANRKPQLRDTEMPFWLTVGLTQILLAQPDLVLVLKKPESNGREMVAEEVVRTVRRHDMLSKVRSRLSSRRAFDFSEVAMPSPAHIRGENWKDFQACSHLLVDRLLALPMGGQRLQGMIRLLPDSLNWQTAFLKVYGDLFADMLVVEKWWAVMIVQFTGQNQYQNWTLLEAVEKLENLLKLPAEVKLTDADSPFDAEISLQQALRGWDFEVQKPIFQQKINQLIVARLKMPRQLIPFVNEYGRIIEAYLVQRVQIQSFKPRRGHARPKVSPLIEETVRLLDGADRRLVLFKPKDLPPKPLKESVQSFN